MARKVVIFGTSLDPESKSQLLARQLARRLEREDCSWKLVDLRDHELPESGRPGALTSPAAEWLKQTVADATHVVFAVAIYNYSVSSAAKNLIELMTAEEMKDKVVGFLCAAGGRNSYMAVAPLATSLMLDFRAWVVPRYVYAVGSDFDGLSLKNPAIHSRIDQLARDLLEGPAAYRDEAPASEDTVPTGVSALAGIKETTPL